MATRPRAKFWPYRAAAHRDEAADAAAHITRLVGEVLHMTGEIASTSNDPRVIKKAGEIATAAGRIGLDAGQIQLAMAEARRVPPDEGETP